MHRDKKRYGQDPSVVVRSKPGTFKKPLSRYALTAADPDVAGAYKWADGSRVFTCSWSDFFIEEADPWRGEAWDIIRQRPGLTFQILTKRPERISGCLPDDWGEGWPNVWLGITAEDQGSLDTRAQFIVPVPAKVKFISYEPALAPLCLSEYVRDDEWGGWLSWVIAGCESGPNRRPTEWSWVEGLRDQCVAAGILFFLKQMDVDGKVVHQPELGGRQWLEFPA
jgi:protein gp37